MDQPFADRFWESDDGLKLHYRDYSGDPEHVPVVCMHGLTRNARDFAELAAHLAGNRRVIVPEMRGRGNSDYAKGSESYAPPRYVQDVEILLKQLDISRFIAIGTSLGGLMTMLLALAGPERIVGAVLNDIGPVVEPEGIEGIRSYVGQGGSFPTWIHAAKALEEVHAHAHPGFGLEDWLAMAKRVMVIGQGGRISFDYDMAIADPFRAADSNAVPPDGWPAFEALAGTPLLLVRGAHSNILSPETVAQMQSRHSGMEVVTIADTGHAPLLTEPEAVAAIDRLLEPLA
ncbi:alpha/beta fold hydrolase [Parerythrobacter jejuensis]|uniref:Alpha/beta fold hydrolase n=1 Tax=Parerythrobacter jejuensis TaxID=795812 RepID=A0A845AM50_9SPHN|nr:alpha/beta hydrolase [Parerythrobacter jejuensis]MXP31862.1 alpha/beta fold hydrolase [Parerythrobacter jejuensis]